MTAGDRYLEIVLRLQRIASGLVDGYTGPPELAARIAGEPTPAPAALGAAAAALRAELAADRWIAAQLAGIEAACDVLGGARVAYGELVERCYGVTPAEVSGTRERFGLPDGEGVDVEVVEDELWFAYAAYEGGLRSRISINTDLPVHGFDLLDLVAHEIYPGHHTEHILKPGCFAVVHRLQTESWPPYESCYTEGASLCGAFAETRARRLPATAHRAAHDE